MTLQYTSTFSTYIREMIELRKSLGKSPRTYAYELQSFDRFCARYFPEASRLTRELASKWCEEGKPTCGSGYRMRAMRAFGLYLNSIGVDAFVFPSEWITKPKTGIPYIFKDIELKKLFNAADEIPAHINSPLREYTLPVMFRLLFCCGLRPQEARRLKRKEVDVKNCRLFITSSKRNRDRLLPISAELATLCQKYDRIANAFSSYRQYFFQTPKGCEYNVGWMTAQYHRCRRLSGNIAAGSTPYDLRHNFATRTLMRWVEEKKDIGAWLPYLSAYMGHETYSGTAYYIHLLPERLSKCDFTKIDAIVPEVPI